MRYQILQSEIVSPPEEIREVRLRKGSDEMVYLDVGLPNGMRAAVVWLNPEGELHVDKANTDAVGLKYIGG